MSTRIKLIILIALLLCVTAAGGFIAYQYANTAKELRETQADLDSYLDENDVIEDEEEEYVPTPEELLENRIDEVIADMTIEEKVAQLFVITPEALTDYDTVLQAGSVTEEAFGNYPVGGIILFAKNLESVSQTKQMNENLQSISDERLGIPLLIGVDEEGGAVARCAKKLGTTSFLPMYQYRDQGTQTAKDNARTIAQDISSLGFTADFAPVADTWSNPANEVIGTRAYSDDYEEAAQLVGAAVEGFDEGGVDCCLKHFPGHGDTAEDSHKGSAYSDKTIDELMEEDLVVFKSGIDAGADMVMAGHITMSNVDNLPASLSGVMIDEVLRGRLGYGGVVITDSLGMGAISNNYSSSAASIKAINAGVDMLMMPKDFKSAYSGVLAAVNDGEISDDRIDGSVRRILRMKLKDEYLN